MPLSVAVNPISFLSYYKSCMFVLHFSQINIGASRVKKPGERESLANNDDLEPRELFDQKYPPGGAVIVLSTRGCHFTTICRGAPF